MSTTSVTSPARGTGRLLHRPVDTGPAFWGPGDHYTFLITGEEAGGAYFAMVLTFTPAGIEGFLEESLERAPNGALQAPENVIEVAARYVAVAPRYGLEFV